MLNTSKVLHEGRDEKLVHRLQIVLSVEGREHVWERGRHVVDQGLVGNLCEGTGGLNLRADVRRQMKTAAGRISRPPRSRSRDTCVRESAGTSGTSERSLFVH